MSGPKENMAKGWNLIQDAIEIGDVEPIGLFLGCKHESIEMKLKNGNIARGMRYNVEGSLKECVALSATEPPGPLE